MKPIHLKTHDHHSMVVSSMCSKAAYVMLFAFIMLNITQSESLHSLSYQGNETDHIALLAIKDGLVDQTKGVLSSWNNSVHHCYWEGVTCWSENKRVTVLDLNSRGLSGTISPFIGNLSFLNAILLYNNSLHGRIPHTLGGLFRLRLLGLNNNALVGEIPANLSSCINLRYLYITHNKLQGKLPVELRALSKLVDLMADSNKLIGPLFDIIQNFTFLETISVTFNSFTGIIPNFRMRSLINLCLGGNKFSGTLPLSLFNISSLRYIDLNDNLLHGELPPHMGFSVRHLTALNLAGNNFSGSIPAITNFTSLEDIILEENSFTGKVPHEFQHFKNLGSLFLSNNYLEGDINFINTLVNCTQLRFLVLMGNNFSGTFPKSVANLSTTLTRLTIGDSMISGTLPEGITNLINLQAIYIADSRLTASIPHDIGKLYKLERLELPSNRLTGKIPDSLGNISLLSRLDLSDNRLEESIPLSIGNCQNLLTLNLSHNELNGTLHEELFTRFTSFVDLDFSYNHLGGHLPLEISKQTGLGNLRLSKNKFLGVLPEGLGECTELQYLYMDGNSFNGDIPSSYANLTSLQEIDFSQNNLSGPIPDFFSKISSIYHLDLSYNDFQGMVPTNSIFANASAVFLVGNSRLCGGIPQLQLPRCIPKNSMQVLKLIISVISALIVVLAIVIWIHVTFIRKKKTPLSLDSVTGETFTKVSYDMLLKATGGFSSENLLGSGAFGSVFKGDLNGVPVAVKVLNLRKRIASKSFMAECNSLRNIRHRNLVGIITACSSIDFHGDDFKALIYEFMPNGSLDTWLNGILGKMNLSQRVGIAIDVAHALNYIHRECETPIAHCDLKPSNILLDHDMVAHVSDFGLAKFITAPHHPNQSSTIGIRGTIGYTAPEYGLGSEPSTAGDVYSYGILLLELMTGKSPTDNMFKEDYNLHMYAEAALPEEVLQIADPTLEEDSLLGESDDRSEIKDAHQRRVECIISVISIGVLCSNHLPQDRMKITDAINRLQSARNDFLHAK